PTRPRWSSSSCRGWSTSPSSTRSRTPGRRSSGRWRRSHRLRGGRGPGIDAVTRGGVQRTRIGAPPARGESVGIDRRRVLGVIGGLGAAGLVSACGGGGTAVPATHQAHARIGLLVPGTGAYKQVGDGTLDGVQLAPRRTGN